MAKMTSSKAEKHSNGKHNLASSSWKILFVFLVGSAIVPPAILTLTYPSLLLLLNSST